MDQRRELVRLASLPGASKSALARAFGVNRKTLDKWLARASAGGQAPLADRSRRPASSPGRTRADMEAAVLELRARHPAWGGRKLRHALIRERGAAPAASTITEILRRNGVPVGVFGGGAKPFVRFEHAAPNDLWQMDFKGHVPIGAGDARLHPLTVLDDHSRYCIVLKACADERTGTVKNALRDAFFHHGLPDAIVCDNGAPWGSGPGSPYTPLGVWLIEHGVRVAHSRPYHPQTMGKDERFHRTLDLEVLRAGAFPAFIDADATFDRWRAIYNTRRPHEAIGHAVPADRYRPSPRAFADAVAPFDYRPTDIVRRVQHGGRVHVFGAVFRIPKAFHGKRVALRAAEEDGRYDLFFRAVRIGALDRRTLPCNPPDLSTMSPNDCP